jgi:hypothetical protein
MRVLHRTAAVLLGLAATVVVAELVNAALSGDHLKVLNFILFAIGAALAFVLAMYLWRGPGS